MESNESKLQDIKYYIGEITEVGVDGYNKEYHLIKAKIPGIADEISAFPKVGELDEPRIGDQVLLLCLDPIYFSYFIYSKLKEDDFIGFRASGKMLDITPDSMCLSVYGCENTHDTERPGTDIKSRLRMEDSGDIDIYSTGEVRVNYGTREVVNIGPLCEFMRAVKEDLCSDSHGAKVSMVLDDIIRRLGDKNFKH